MPCNTLGTLHAMLPKLVLNVVRHLETNVDNWHITYKRFAAHAVCHCKGSQHMQSVTAKVRSTCSLSVAA